MEQDSFNQLSSLVEGRLPEFVRVDHPTIVAFLEAYYEWLQIKDRSGIIISPMVLQDVIDIDSSMDEFLTHFKREYLLDFPEQLAIAKSTGKPVDVRKLMKNIKSFYQAKGTEKSYEFLFQILYNTSVEFYYPKKDILRVSDGKWYEKVSIKITNAIGDRIFDSVGRIVYQKNSEGKIVSSAKVIDVTLYQQGQYEVAELILTGRNGTFSIGKEISFDVENETLHELRVYSVIGSVTINDGGTGYAVGDRVLFSSVGGDSGEGAIGTVSLVTAVGAIRRLRMDNFGINYTAVPTVQIQSSGGSGFSGTAVVSSICQSEGYYLNSDGRIGTNKVLQDNHYYQDYSYVLKTEVVIDEYRDTLRRLIHPAGTAMFGQVLIKRCSREDVFNSSALIRYEVPIIGHYIPYTFTTHENLQDWFSTPGTGNNTGTNVVAGYDPTLHDGYLNWGGYDDFGVPLKGNPFRFNAPFINATGPTYSPLGLSGFQNADPFWIVYEHPNRKISERVIAQIWRGQLADFSRWNERVTVTGGQMADSWWDEFENDPTLDKKYAFLQYDKNSAFRKITARSFFNMPIGEEFDCRTESVEKWAKPLVKIHNPLNGETITSVISANAPLNVQFTIENFENLAVHFGGKFVRVWLDGSHLAVLNLGVFTTPITTLSGGMHNILVEVLDENYVPLMGMSDSVVFGVDSSVPCCSADGTVCTNKTINDCVASGGSVLSTCADCFPPSICCNSIVGLCVSDLSPTKCLQNLGTVVAGTNCDDCGTAPIIKCCIPPNALCLSVPTNAQCALMGGVVVSTCDACVPVAPEVGVCCDSNQGDCVINVSPVVCGTIFQGTSRPGNTCDVCDVIRNVICCPGDMTGICITNLDAEECERSTDGWVVDDCASCFTTCCLPNGTCQLHLSPEVCAQESGTFFAQQADCLLCTPAEVGCCLPDGSCVEDAGGGLGCADAGGRTNIPCDECMDNRIVNCCKPGFVCTTDGTAIECTTSGGTILTDEESCENDCSSPLFKILVDSIPTTGDLIIDNTYRSMFTNLGVGIVHTINVGDVIDVGGFPTQVMLVNPSVSGVGGVVPNISAIMNFLLSRGIELNSTTTHYVSFNFSKTVWESLVLGVGDDVVNGTNSASIIDALRTNISILTSLFGANVRFSVSGYPSVQIFSGNYGGSPIDPNGGWYQTSTELQQARIDWSAQQFEPAYVPTSVDEVGLGWSNPQLVDYSPTQASADAKLLIPSDNGFDGVDSVYDYDRNGIRFYKFRRANVKSSNIIASELALGLNYETIPMVDRYFSGNNNDANFYYKDGTGRIIPSDDVVGFVGELKRDSLVKINGIYLHTQTKYMAADLACMPTISVPGDQDFVVPESIPEWGSWFTGTVAQWQSYYATFSVEQKKVQERIRESSILLFYDGVPPFNVGGGTAPLLFGGWGDPEFKVDLIMKYNDYTLNIIQRIRNLP